MRVAISILVGLMLAVAGCSSGDETPNPCAGSDASLAARRASCEFAAGASTTQTIGCPSEAIPIEHVVIIMQENRSFDQYFGHLPGHGQDDVDVVAVASNPDPSGTPIPWHHETEYCVADTDHGWSASHTQWNHGRNDGFAITNADTGDPTGQRAMGFYEQEDLPFYYDLASTFAISDRYFCSILGPTYPNRYYLAAGTSFGIVTTDTRNLAPSGVPNIYEALNEKGVSWKSYATSTSSAFLFFDFALHQTAHFAPASQFAEDAANGDLPQVSFVEAGFSESAFVETDEHPPADIQLGQHFVWQQVTALTSSPLWSSSVLFITYDEHGGLYDHVSPPAACEPDETPPQLEPELGPFNRLGFRVPLIVVSPWVRRHFVSHQIHSHTSILRFLETKFDLPAFTRRDANSDALLDLFDFDSPPRLAVPAFAEPPVDADRLADCRAAFP
jgi:phospholipase C